MLFENGTHTENLARIQSSVKFLIGLLSILSPKHLEKASNEIVEFLSQSGVALASDWLIYAEEGIHNQYFMNTVRGEMEDDWYFEDLYVSKGIAKLIQNKSPSHVNFTIRIDPSSLNDFEDILQVCATKQNMSLTLHIYHHFWIEKTSYSDKYLDILSNSNNGCKLSNFAGRLSSDRIEKLPETIQRLALHVNKDNLKSLSKSVTKLVDLKLLYLNLDFEPGSLLDQIPHLRFDTEKTALAVDIWRISHNTVQWACDIASAISDKFSRLVLRRTQLTAEDVQTWICGLINKRIKVMAIVVGSTEKISPEKEFNISKMARQLGCKEFRWIDL